MLTHPSLHLHLHPPDASHRCLLLRPSQINYTSVDRGCFMQVVDLMGQDMVVYRVDNGVGTKESKVCLL